MSLVGKDPVDKPCEADSFEEAALKNHARLAHEQQECETYYEEMAKKGETPLESLHPSFWHGAVNVNNKALAIYQEEMTEALKRAAGRVLALDCGPAGKYYKSGWNSIRDSWAKALQKNDPQAIVYW